MIATNLRIGRLELDVVARRADLIVVVEVRFRGAGSWTSGFKVSSNGVLMVSS